MWDYIMVVPTLSCCSGCGPRLNSCCGSHPLPQVHAGLGVGSGAEAFCVRDPSPRAETETWIQRTAAFA